MSDLSVILTSRNHGQYIGLCIDSIANALGVGLPILHADVDSRDRTIAVAQDHYLRNKQQVQLQQMSGATTDVLAALAQQATTEYVVLLSGDDLLTPNYGSIARRHLKVSPEVDILNVSSRVIRGDELTSEVISPRWTSLDAVNRKLIFATNPGRAPGALVRRSLLLESMKRHPGQLVEDYLLWFHGATAGKVRGVKEIGAHYRVHAESVSQGLQGAYIASLAYTADFVRRSARTRLDGVSSRVFRHRILRHIHDERARALYFEQLALWEAKET